MNRIIFGQFFTIIMIFGASQSARAESVQLKSKWPAIEMYQDFESQIEDPYRVSISSRHITETDWQNLLNSSSVRVVDLSYSSVTDSMLKDLKRLPHLEELRLVGTAITDRGIKYLVRSKSLRTLDLSSTRISDQSFKALAKLKSLQKLSVTHTTVGNDFCKHITRLSGLTSLDLSSTTIDNFALRELNRARSLQELELNSTSINDAGVTYLRSMSRLKKLTLMQVAVSDNGLNELLALQNLLWLDLRQTLITAQGYQKFRSQFLPTLNGNVAIMADYDPSIVIPTDDPTIQLASPCDGQIIPIHDPGPVPIIVAISTPTLAELDLLVDGAVRERIRTFPFRSFSWNLRSEKVGRHIVRLTAYDRQGRFGTTGIRVTLVGTDIEVMQPAKGAHWIIGHYGHIAWKTVEASRREKIRLTLYLHRQKVEAIESEIAKLPATGELNWYVSKILDPAEGYEIEAILDTNDRSDPNEIMSTWSQPFTILAAPQK